MMSTKKAFVLMGAIFCLSLFQISVRATTYFTGKLSSAQEVPSNSSTATGFGRVTLNDAETQITFSLTFSGLSSNQTASHIHGPAPVGANAPVLFNIGSSGATTGIFTALSAAVTPAQVADLKAGLFYFNVHSTNFGGGEIRGQIKPDSPYVAYLDNNQENPPTTSSARGSGFVSLDTITNQAYVTMNWSGLSGAATGGHIHTGRSRINGPIICNLSPAAAASGSVTDVLCSLTPTQVTDLKRAQLYLNLHTAANSGGEIRGQLQRQRSTVVDFDGDSKTDYAIARNNTTANTIEWWIANSGGGISTFPLGVSSEFSTGRIVTGDFDNDGKDDPAIWRTGASPAAGFLILESGSNTTRFEQFGTTGDDPRIVYDYDGDGRCDPAVWRASTGTWFFLGSSNNPGRNTTYVQWGVNGDFANPGDYDGDGKGDFVVQRGGNWWLLRSNDLNFQVISIGTGTSFGVPGDYDGDGKTDVGVTQTEGSQLVWYYASSLNPSQNAYSTRAGWGPAASRTRAQGDYDGDGRSDYAVYISAATPAIGFWVLPSNGSSYTYTPWGLSTDFPIAGYNNR